jgi:hypothetical protein
MENENIMLVQTGTNEIIEINSSLTGSTMTKAGKLALELAHEKRRLK